MSDIEYDEWMSESDALLWHIERDPLLRSTVTSVWLLDSLPSRDRFDPIVERMIRRLPRLSQRVIDDRTGIATPRWAEDPHFDPTYHVRRIRLPGRRPGTTELLEHAEHVASRSFDKDRPLWGLELVEGLPRSGAALVLTLHHAIADGLGLVNMLQHLVELEPGTPLHDAALPIEEEPARPAAGPGVPAAGRSVTHRVSEEAKTGLRLGRATMRTASELLRDPIGTVRGAARTTSSVAGIVKPTPRPMSTLMTARSMTPRFRTLTVPLGDLKIAARSIGGTINDAFVASVLDGLDRYHRHHEAGCDAIRMAMPVSVRARDDTKSTNQFVPARVELPLGAPSAADRLADTRSRLRVVRDEPALPHMSDISGVIGRLGPAASVALIGGMMKGVDVTTSNVPGPPFPLWIGGAKVEEFFAFGPTAGAALNITLFSYDGVAYIGINLDDRAIPDANVLVDCLRSGIDATLALADRGSEVGAKIEEIPD